MKNILRDESLAGTGREKINWVKQHMPLLADLEKRFEVEKPFAGLRIALSVHLEAKTARLALVLRAGGAEMHVTGSNPLSTQDDVAAGLASYGIRVCAWYGATGEEYHTHLVETLLCKPHIVIDDGGDLVNILHEERPDLAEFVIGGSEETTTGVLRLKARARDNALNFPMVCVNDAMMKFMFDNRYGTGQSVWDGIMRTTNLVIAGKTIVVAGYGWCGRGVAMRAKGLGAKVIVTEVNPIKAIEAYMDGFEVMRMIDAAPLGDFFVTVTGCKGVITTEHFMAMKDGAILSNAGHFDVEVDVKALRESAIEIWQARKNIEAFKMPCGRVFYLLAEGRLVNLAAGDGHPAEIMDISFALQALSAEYVAKSALSLSNGVHDVPDEIDQQVAYMKLATLGSSIDVLSDDQAAYLSSWEHA